MRHHVRNRKFGREKDQRKALLRSLARSLIVRGKVKTTEARAKELRPAIEKLITIAKAGTISSKRLIISKLGGIYGAKKLCDEIAVKYKDRKGGYTRITKLPVRPGDASKIAIIEFV